MGHYTRYELQVDEESELIDRLRDKYEDAAYAIQPNGETGESCKWYDCDEHLIEFSKLHPERLFTLTGYGEDIWRNYYRNGVKQKAETTISFSEWHDCGRGRCRNGILVFSPLSRMEDMEGYMKMQARLAEAIGKRDAMEKKDDMTWSGRKFRAAGKENDMQILKSALIGFWVGFAIGFLLMEWVGAYIF